MNYFKKLAEKLEGKISKEHRQISSTLQARDETELLVILGAELAEFSKEKKMSIKDITRAQFTSAVGLTPVPIYGKAKNALDKFDDKAIKMVADYAQNYLDFKPQKEEISKIAISGGGGKGNVYKSMIEGLENIGVMDQVSHVSGASAGAITALTLGLGYKSSELEELLTTRDFNTFFFNATPLVRGAARAGAALSTVFSNSESLEKLNKINNGNLSYKLVRDEVANHLDDIIESDPHLRAEFNTFLEHESVENIKGKAKENLSKENMLMSRILETDPLQRKYNTTLRSYKPSRLDNRVGDDVWQHKHGRDYMDDRILEFTDLLSKSRMNDNPILDHCNKVREKIVEKTGSDPFQSSRDVLNIAVKMRRGQHLIEEFFADLIAAKIDQLADDVGVEQLTAIDERFGTHEGRRDASLQAINDIADRIPESGFKNVSIAITRGKSLSSLWDGEGVIVDKTKEISILDPAKHLARISMSIPLVFHTVHTDLGPYVDGGVRNNLPTKHFDSASPDGFDKSVLSVITVTEGEAKKHDGFHDIFGPKMQKLNTAYNEISMRESFRTIILNSGKYSTLDFKFKDEDFKELNSQALDKIQGVDSERNYGVFHKYGNAQLSFLNSKLINYQHNDKYDLLLERYNDKTKTLSQSKPFQHLGNRNSLTELLKKAQIDHSDSVEFHM